MEKEDMYLKHGTNKSYNHNASQRQPPHFVRIGHQF